MSIFGKKDTFIDFDDKKTTSIVGKDVKGFCSRCKLNLSHTVLTTTSGEKPDRVRCNTCKSERTFRASKDVEELKKVNAEGKKVSDRDEDFEIDPENVSKALLGETPKKKAKPKAKAKKAKDEDSKPLTKAAAAAMPLSMLKGSAEDIASFETKLLQFRNHIAAAKAYSASARFNQGEILSHKTFGTGFVVAEMGLSKIEVLFKDGRKLLVTANKA
jgi:hypothetical protein